MTLDILPPQHAPPPISKLNNQLTIFFICYYVQGLKIRIGWGHTTLGVGIIFLTKTIGKVFMMPNS
jgi:hypothetical protein